MQAIYRLLKLDTIYPLILTIMVTGSGGGAEACAKGWLASGSQAQCPRSRLSKPELIHRDRHVTPMSRDGRRLLWLASFRGAGGRSFQGLRQCSSSEAPVQKTRLIRRVFQHKEGPNVTKLHISFGIAFLVALTSMIVSLTYSPLPF